MRAFLISAVGLGAAMAVAPLADAAFPGKNGRIVISSEREGPGAIYTMASNGRAVKRLTTSGVAYEPAYSRSGTKIVFTLGVGNASEIWSMDASGKRKRKLTRNGSPDAAADWSPSGKKIVFRATRLNPGEAAANSDIWVMNANGTGQTRLTTSPRVDDDPVFSPDGTQIAFHSFQSGTAQIWVMNADGSGQVQVTKDPIGAGTPDWSPDGTHLVFQSRRDGRGQIYSIAVDGSDEKRLTNSSYLDNTPAFSPDGRKVVFQRRILGAGGKVVRADDVYVISANGGKAKRLTKSNGFDGRPDWQSRR
jgi:Tol biopolymer transport system component